jgi:hypothetical protein
MPQDPAKDVHSIVETLVTGNPMIQIGHKLAKGGELIQRGVETVRRKVQGAPPKRKRDIVLPRSGVKGRRMSR